jgi:preprotein translocase subunit SecD
MLVAGSVCLAILLASAIRARANTHSYTMTYLLVADQGGVTPQTLEESARIVRARVGALARSHALKAWEVETESGDQVRIAFRTQADPSEILDWVTMTGRAEFCLVHPDAGILDAGEREDLPEEYHVKVYDELRYSLSRPGEMTRYRQEYLISKEPAMRVRQFAAVDFATAGLKKETVLTFRFEEEQGEQFEDLTAVNVGRQMAMLIDGEMFFPPSQVGSAVAGGAVQVRGYFYNPPLRKLVKMLNAGTLPGQLEQVSQQVE